MKENKKLAAALKNVKHLLDHKDGNIIHTSEIGESDRRILVRNRWLESIVRGWYYVSNPALQEGDTRSWYANFWMFVSRYLNYRYGADYCLSAENSIDVHLQRSSVPTQVIAILKKGGGKPIELPHATSIYPYKDPSSLPEHREQLRGLQVMPLPLALLKASPTFFRKDPQTAEIAMRQVRSFSEFLPYVERYGLLSGLGRLVGGYEFLGDSMMAEGLREFVQESDLKVIQHNPFKHVAPFTEKKRASAHVLRIEGWWNELREPVMQLLPEPPGRPTDRQAYLARLDDLYRHDAYHSLSIEGFRISSELLDRIESGKWQPADSLQDKENRNALAALGYSRAFGEVRKAIQLILDGRNAGEVVQQSLQRWLQQLFSPCVEAGLLNRSDLAGYRGFPVYIRNSRHVPLAPSSVLDAMEALFECLKTEPHPAVRAVLGHFLFVYIHPYMDGNGRVGRFLMNAMFASGGYNWTIIEEGRREEYFSALEAASVEGNIHPFAQFILSEMNRRW